MNDMPMFDDPIQPTEPVPPKKPRQKPTRKRKVREAAPKVVKKRRKKRAPNKPKLVPIAGSSAAEIISAYEAVRQALSPLTEIERNAILDDLR